jgi:hypothetical protein
VVIESRSDLDKVQMRLDILTVIANAAATALSGERMGMLPVERHLISALDELKSIENRLRD